MLSACAAGVSCGCHEAMRITITKRPNRRITDIYFTSWRVGDTYDVSPGVASVLMAEGWAQLEMRTRIDRRRERRAEGHKRRQQG